MCYLISLCQTWKSSAVDLHIFFFLSIWSHPQHFGGWRGVFNRRLMLVIHVALLSLLVHIWREIWLLFIMLKKCINWSPRIVDCLLSMKLGNHDISGVGNLNNNWMTAVIGWSRYVKGWAILSLVGGRILYLVQILSQNKYQILNILWQLHTNHTIKTSTTRKHDTLTQCCFNVSPGDAGPTLKQHWAKVACLAGLPLDDIFISVITCKVTICTCSGVFYSIINNN